MENKKIYYLITFITVLFRFILIFLPGHQYDLAIHQRWSESILKNGLLSIYQTASPNLPPLWIYILSITTLFYQLIFQAPLSQWALKIPAVLSDLFTAYFIFYFLKKKVSFNLSFSLFLLYLLHPFVLYNSSIWGQWDSLFVLPIIVSLIFLEKNRLFLSTIFLTISFLIKLQGIIFFPLFLFFIFKKYKIKKLMFSLLFSFLTILLVCLPFLISKTSLALLFEKTWLVSSRMMPNLSNNAFNFWWIPQILIGLGKEFVKDSVLFVGPINYRLTGFILFALGYFFILLWWNNKKNDNLINNFILAKTFIAFSFYFLPTEMHERYLFPFFALFCLILPWAIEIRRIFIILSITGFLNLVYCLPLTFLNQIWQEQIKSILGELSILISLINLATFIYFLFYLLYEKNFNRLTNFQRRNSC